MKIRTLALAAGALAVSLALAACTADTGMEGMNHESNTAPTAAPFNDPDVAFAMNMIPHHQQAIEMADTLLAKDGVDERVVALAENIKAAQGPEIETMTDWLEAWGHPYEAMEGMHHGDGMMTEADMDALDAATGADASRLFLEQMIEHHEGAITMGEEQVSTGENPDAIDLAKHIVQSQSAEIEQMRQLLATP